MDRILTSNENKVWVSSDGERFDNTIKDIILPNVLDSPSGIDIIITNTSTQPLFIKMGQGGTMSDFDFVLRGCFVALDGTGGVLSLTGIHTLQPITADSLDLRYTYSYRGTDLL